MPDIYYSISSKMEKLAENYLEELRIDPSKAGARLQAFLTPEVLKDWFETDLAGLTVRQLISTLMSTKQPVSHRESDVSDTMETDWSPTELQILSDVSLLALDMAAYNNGKGRDYTDFPEPQHEHVIFLSGAILTSGSKPGNSYDTPELISGGCLNAEAFFHHYEDKLMPVLLSLNKAAAERGENIVLNIPDLASSEQTGPYELAIRQELPHVIHEILEMYASQLTNIHTVNYSPSIATGLDGSALDEDIGEGKREKIHFQIRPVETEKETRGPLEFPADITEEQIRDKHLVLAKLIVGSPTAWPGNDIWENKRSTDESVTFTSMNSLSQMLASGTLVIKKPNPEYQLKYNPETGCEQFYRKVDGLDEFCSHSEMLSVLGLKFVAHSYKIHTVACKADPLVDKAASRAAHGFWGDSKPVVGEVVAPRTDIDPKLG